MLQKKDDKNATYDLNKLISDNNLKSLFMDENEFFVLYAL